MRRFLAWLDEHPERTGTGPTPAPPAARLPRRAGCAQGLARRSISSRVAALRSFYRYARRQGWVRGDPWSAVVTPRLLRAPAAGSWSVGEVETAPRRPSGHRGHRSTTSAAVELRDRAIVETAYAAGPAHQRAGGGPRGRPRPAPRRELRVLGKGRKERMALLGGPAREALEAYLPSGGRVSASGAVGSRTTAPSS